MRMQRYAYFLICQNFSQKNAMIFGFFRKLALSLHCFYVVMLIQTKALVLRTVTFADRKIIVDMFTHTHGRMSFIVVVPNSPRAKMKKQFFQPLTLLELSLDYRQHLSLQRIKEVRIAMPYTSLTSHPHKLSISLFVAEFLCHALKSEQQNELLFHYIIDSMLWLDNCPSGFANFHIVFMMRLSRFLGFYPNLDDYHAGSVFDLQAACFVGTLPAHRYFLSATDSAAMRVMMRMDFPTMHLFRMSHEERNRLVEAIITFYRLHLPDFPELRSLEVLKELYG